MRYWEITRYPINALSKHKAKHFSDIIAKNAHSPKIVFSAINTALNHANALPDATFEITEQFFWFFINKVDTIRSCISLTDQDPSKSILSPASLNYFMPVALSALISPSRISRSRQFTQIQPIFGATQNFDQSPQLAITGISRDFNQSQQSHMPDFTSV